MGDSVPNQSGDDASPVVASCVMGAFVCGVGLMLGMSGGVNPMWWWGVCLLLLVGWLCEV